MKNRISPAPANRKAFNEYHKQYRKAHPDKAKQALIKYWAKKIKEQTDTDSQVNNE
jgi:hypothetical protein